MPLSPGFAGAFLKSERYLRRYGKELLDHNQRLVRQGDGKKSVLQIQPLTNVAAQGHRVGEMLALAAAHAGCRLESTDTIRVEMLGLESPIPSLGVAASPGINQVDITLYPFLEKPTFTEDELQRARKKCIIPFDFLLAPLLQSGIIPTARRGGMSIEYDTAPFLAQVLSAEFAHAAEFLARNHRGELNAVQLNRNLLDPAKRAAYRAQGFSAHFFPASYSSLGIAEILDATMQQLGQPLEDLLPTLLYGLYTYHYGNQVDRSLMNNSELRIFFRHYIEEEAWQEHLNNSSKLTFLDFALPYLPFFISPPDTHGAAKLFSNCAEIKLIDWWLKGYLRPDRVSAVYRALHSLLVLAQLARITYPQLPENTAHFRLAGSLGLLTAGAFLLETYFAIEKMHQRSFEARKMQAQAGMIRAEALSDIIGADFSPYSLHQVIIPTHFTDEKVNFTAWFQERVLTREYIKNFVNSNPPATELPSSQGLVQIVKTGSPADLKEWILSLRYHNGSAGQLFSLPNPLWQCAKVILEATSPVDVENYLQHLSREAAARLPRTLPNRQMITHHLRQLTAFEDGGWGHARSAEELDQLWILTERDLYTTYAYTEAQRPAVTRSINKLSQRIDSET